MKGRVPFRLYSQERETPSIRAVFSRVKNKDWLVYAKPPFGGPEQVLKYLARYTHRVAISNRRLLALGEDTVTFSWKDYANGNRKRTMTLDPMEFLRRFLVHVPPSGFMRIRYYGFLANRNRADNLLLVRRLIDEQRSIPKSAIVDVTTQPITSGDTAAESDLDICPQCKQGQLVVILRVGYPGTLETWSFDSS